jgi:molybdenum cofactor biosynthesis protein B
MHEHRRDQKAEAVVALMITSDTRTPENDETGKRAIKLLEGAGHTTKIEETFRGFTDDGRTQVIITSGGTGISSRDKTVDAVTGLLDKEIPGFGELFRRLSFEEIGEAAMFSRATAGIIGRKLVFCLPGSKAAVDTALKKIILPGLGHMLWEVNR